MSNSFFHFKQFSIYSQEKGLRVTTDSCLLGAIANHKNPEYILDIGTGTGVITLLMAQRFNEARIDAIEIDKTIAQQALNNISESKFKDRINLIEGDYLQYKPNQLYDLIVCNPPYFKKYLQKLASEKNNAIHNNQLDHEALLKKVSNDLTESGCLYIILPIYEANLLIKNALNTDWYIKEVYTIFNRPDKLYRKIVGLVKYSTETSDKKLLLKKDDNSNSVEFQQLMHDFYLEDTQIYKNKKH